jgi:hypothetical protein
MPSKSLPCRIFISYAHRDNDYDNDKIVVFSKVLPQALNVFGSKDVSVFLDTDSVEWGDTWKGVIQQTVRVSTFMIPFISPSYFGSPNCMEEWDQFRDLERSLGRNDLILPIYWIEDPEFEAIRRGENTLVAPWPSDLAQRQYQDWRNKRQLSSGSKQFRLAIEKMAKVIQKLLVQIAPSFDIADSGLAGARSSATDTPDTQVVNSNGQDERYEASVILKVRGLTDTQRIVLYCVYEKLNSTEIPLDTLYSVIQGMDDVHVSSPNELYYRLRDLWHQRLLNLVSTGRRLSSVIRIDDVHMILHKHNLLKT